MLPEYMEQFVEQNPFFCLVWIVAFLLLVVVVTAADQ